MGVFDDNRGADEMAGLVVARDAVSGRYGDSWYLTVKTADGKLVEDIGVDEWVYDICDLGEEYTPDSKEQICEP